MGVNNLFLFEIKIQWLFVITVIVTMNIYLISLIPTIQVLSSGSVTFATLRSSFAPTCLILRDRTEEYVNGYCIYETKYMTDLLERISALEERLGEDTS